MSTASSSSRVVGAAKLISALTLASRGLGLIRDATCTYFLGGGGVSAAFWMAFLVPNLFRRLFGEGALSAAFIPVFSDYHHGGDRTGARRVAGCVLGLLLVVLLTFLLLSEVTVAGLWFFGPASERARLTLLLTALMLPFMVLICTTAMLGGLLNVLGHFATPATTPIVMNVCMIAAAVGAGAVLGASPNRLVFYLGGAVLLAGGLQVGMHWIVIRRRDFVFAPVLDPKHEAVRRIARTMGPMVLGLGAVQINTFADMLIAAWCVDHDGAPTVLYLAQRLYDFPLGVFGIALVTAVFAELSRLATLNNMTAFTATVQKGLQLVLFIGLPASAGLILVREPLVAFLFERGQFVSTDTERVADTLLFYAAGVWAYGCQHVFIRSFYALKDSRTPLRVAVCMILLNVPLNLILVWPLAEGGLALATAVCAAIQVLWLGHKLIRRVGHVEWRAVWKSVAGTAVATIAMTIAVVAVDGRLPESLNPGLRVGGLVAVGVVVFAAAAYLIHHEELKEILHRG